MKYNNLPWIFRFDRSLAGDMLLNRLLIQTFVYDLVVLLVKCNF